MELKRIRDEDDGSTTEFFEHVFEGKFPYRAEIQFETIDEIRALHAQGRVIGIRMSDVPAKGKQPQRNVIGPRHIKGL